jgi:hypothetical protein
MQSIHPRRVRRPLLALVALVLAGLAFSAASNAAADPVAKHAKPERLVVRGDATVVDAPCPGGLCITFADGTFRGTAVGTGAYTGDLTVKVAEAFPNGEEGICAPIEGRIVLGAGTPNRLVLGVAGDSCQDGSGPVTATSFTGLARFTVKYGTGTYAGAHGGGLASFLEDAADHDRMTLIGRISR